MKLFLLSQKEYHDFTEPDAVNTMLIRAENELEARALADTNESENRDSTQQWSEDFADCEELIVDGRPKVILVS